MAVTARAISVFKALLQHKSVLLYGPPATGKTHLLKTVQTLFEGDLTQIDSEEERNAIKSAASVPTTTAFVTFHQSFGYEDFVIGLRPDPEQKDKLLALKPTPGVLLELSEVARLKGQRSLLLIDEINRGNASRIFGEFITLLDADKRLTDDGTASPQTVKLRLPYQSADRPIEVETTAGKAKLPMPFTMPLRLYVLATMNSVDKSVAPLDAALRRRFHVERLLPELKVICDALAIEVPPDPLRIPEPIVDASDISRLAVALLRSLNDGIAALLGPDFQLGHWFLEPLVGVDNIADKKSRLIELWTNRLLPQLEEYFHGRSDQLKALLRSPQPSDPLSWRAPRPEIEEVGAVPVLERRPADTEAQIAFLRRVSGTEVLAP